MQAPIDIFLSVVGHIVRPSILASLILVRLACGGLRAPLSERYIRFVKVNRIKDGVLPVGKSRREKVSERRVLCLNAS